MCEFQDFLAYFHANGTCWLEFYLPKWKYSFFVTDSVGFVKLFLEKWLEKQEEYMGRTVYERLCVWGGLYPVGFDSQNRHQKICSQCRIGVNEKNHIFDT